MLLNPAILALLGVSLVVSGLLLMAALFAWRILRHWDIRSGSERQLGLERRTYLISTLLVFVFAAELVSLLLFVYTAESLSDQFVGAMCATGVLNINPWGWPTLLLKIALFFAGCAWLALNQLDNRGRDYPLVRPKYRLLLTLLPLAVAEGVTQTAFFLQLDPDVITSCCGSLFTPQGDGVAAELSGMQPLPAALGLFGSAAAVLSAGGFFLWRGRCGSLFALLSLVAFGIALAAVISYLSPYVYEHPHHHCPFCLLKAGHHYIGYWLYLPLFGGAGLALAAGVIAPWRNIASLAAAAPRLSVRYARLALVAFGLFYALSAWVVHNSNLTMQGVWW